MTSAIRPTRTRSFAGGTSNSRRPTPCWSSLPSTCTYIPATLKNAFDNVFVSWALRNKPLAAVGYSTGIAAGVRAIEHLMDVAIEAEMVPLRDTVLIPRVEAAFSEGDIPTEPMTDVAMTVMLEDLEWWGTLLAKGRADGELAPGSFRVRAAMARLRHTRRRSGAEIRTTVFDTSR